jgi:hypothetical protein
MYKKIIISVMSIVSLSSFGAVFAAADITVTPVITTAVEKKIDVRPVTVKEFFTQYCNEVGYGLPDVFIQLPLRITGVKREDPLYTALQKCVYLGFIPNSSVNYNRNSYVTSRFVNVFVSKTLKADPDIDEDNDYLSREDF